MNREDITPGLVSRLVRTQFARWASLPVMAVEPSGWDNATFRLGDELLIRLPTAEQYVPQVDKEHRWLPIFAPRLPIRVPEPLAKGSPGLDYPWPWSVYRWLPGRNAAVERVSDLPRFGTELGEFLLALRSIDPRGGPAPSNRQVFRVGPIQAQDAETRAAIDLARKEIDAALALDVWSAALAAPPHPIPVWIHGDLSPNNLLVDEGRLSAVIDFGCSGIGDPAIDLEIAWGEFSECRRAFRSSVQLDDATWARARGWKLWGSVRGLADGIRTNAEWVEVLRRTVEQVLTDHASWG